MTALPAVPAIVACPRLGCAGCGGGLGVERVTGTLWAWVHAIQVAPAGCPGPVVPAVSVLYLLHLLPAYRHARHYLGFATSSGFLPRRLREHATGRGARLVAVALAAGCRFELVRLWVGGQTLERRLKQQRAVPRLLCPACPTRAQARRLAAAPPAGQGGLLGPIGGAAP